MRIRIARSVVAFSLAASGAAIFSAGQGGAVSEIRSTSTLKGHLHALAAVAITNTTSVPLAGGGEGTTITLGDGSSIQYEIPPSGFKPLMASASTLQLYGFPAKPTGGSALANWDSALSLWRSAPVPNLTFSSTPLMPLSSATTAQTTSVGPGPLSVISSQPWAGFVNDSSSNTEFSGAEGDFNVPTVTNTSSCSYPQLGLWTGIGGQQGSELIIQSGVILNKGFAQNPPPSAWQSFFEYYDQGNLTGIGVTDLIAADNESWSIVPGHEMWSVTTYNPATYQATFFLEDLTTGQSATYTVSGLAAYYDGSSAEAIDEQVYGDHADASQVNWTYVETQYSAHGDWQPLSSYAQNKYYGYYASPSTLSTTDNTSFYVTNNSGC